MKRKRKEATKEVILESDEDTQDDDKEENEIESKLDDDEEKEDQPMKKKQKYLTKSELANMEKVFEEAERWNLSEQGTASIMNAMNAASGKDHQQLIKLLEGLCTGQISEQWAGMAIGKVCSARWTTCQNGCCRAIMSEENPSPALYRIVHFVVFVYGHVFLHIKHKNRVQEAPHHLVREISLVRPSLREHCNEEEKRLTQKAIQDNGFMAHHESVLLSLLGSPDPSDRAFAVDLVLQIREVGEQVWPAKSQGVRPVKTRPIQFGATCLYSLADLSLADTEPPPDQVPDQPRARGHQGAALPRGPARQHRDRGEGGKETTAAALKSSDPVQRDGLSFQISDSRKRNSLKVSKKKQWNI